MPATAHKRCLASFFTLSCSPNWASTLISLLHILTILLLDLGYFSLMITNFIF